MQIVLMDITVRLREVLIRGNKERMKEELVMNQNRACIKARELLKRLPKAELGFFPTPLYRLNRLSAELDVNLYIKRDDFTGMNLFGGNKVRKLEYLMGDALAQGCEYVFTFGATQSNHAMQTVSACRRCGLKPVLYLVAIVKPDEDDIRSNLLLNKLMGAEIHIVELAEGETEAEADARSVELARAHQKRLEAEGHKCYEVPVGGASPIGSVGFIEGFVEFAEQAEAMQMHPDVIFHATGTGGTMAGLAAGKVLTGSDPTIISVNASFKDEGYPERTAGLANESLELIGAACRVEATRDIHTDLNYYLPGYEIPNEAATEAIRLLAEKEGLFIDPVYTGKAFAGMLDYIRSGKTPQGSNVVFWHTGGATALFAEKEILGEI